MPRTTRTPRHATRDLLSIYRELRNTNEPSPYSQIDSDGEGVRLVHLAPGDFDDSIVMHVVPHNLTADAQTNTYDALSYTWGTDLASSMAYLDGIPITITANLDCALRHLRLTMVTRTLWIDAVSINQADTRERNHQVQIMGKIYSAARKVLIWLGPVDQSDYHLRAILGAMQFQFSDGNTSTVTLFDYMCSVISLMIEQNQIIKNTKDCVLDTLHRLVDRPWFHRIWVVQELALSRTVAVHIGSYTFPWQPFEHFANWLPNHKVDPKAYPNV